MQPAAASVCFSRQPLIVWTPTHFERRTRFFTAPENLVCLSKEKDGGVDGLVADLSRWEVGAQRSPWEEGWAAWQCIDEFNSRFGTGVEAAGQFRSAGGRFVVTRLRETLDLLVDVAWVGGKSTETVGQPHRA